MPDTSRNHAYHLNGSRRGIALLLLPATSTVSLIPAWAVLCGAIAARRDGWMQRIWTEPRALVAFVLVTFVVQVLWSTGQGLLVKSVCKGSAHDRAPTAPAQPVPRSRAPVLTYTTPWSPIGRLGRRWRAASLAESERWTVVLAPYFPRRGTGIFAAGAFHLSGIWLVPFPLLAPPRASPKGLVAAPSWSGDRAAGDGGLSVGGSHPPLF